MPDEIICPKCGGTQFHTDKKGFSGKKAVAGAILTGGIGLLAGTIGSNKLKTTCLSCGHEFKVGEKPHTEKKAITFENSDTKTKVLSVIILVAIIWFLLKACS